MPMPATTLYHSPDGVGIKQYQDNNAIQYTDNPYELTS
ncbi:hypothetical protein KKH3_33340 [Pectobacterium actinidiae]|nr:hypothetical protein KKH3_33340 [Pectobacterium actinidiae]